MFPAHRDNSVVDIPKYEKDVLGLHDGLAEKDIDDQLVFEAHSIGLNVTPFFIEASARASNLSPSVASKPFSTRRVSGESTFSSSTGFASILSNASQETHVTHTMPLRMRSESRPYLQHTEYERSFTSPSPSSRSSISLSKFSPPSSRSPSMTHLPQESPSSSFKRGLGRLSRLRKPDLAQTGEVRTSSSSSSRRHTVIAGLASVLARKDEEEHENHILSPLGDRARSPSDSLVGGYGTGLSTPHGSLLSRNASPDVAVMLEEERLRAEAPQNFRRAMQYPEFRELHSRQEWQRDRFLAFASGQQPLLARRRDQLRMQEMDRFPRVMHDMEAHLTAELARLEDRHVVAEMDLREAHELEQRNCLIALRHMKAYCRGEEAGSDQPQRHVTEQDRSNLERQYWLRDHLSQKHESAINVLREQQAKQLRVKGQKHDTEMAVAQRKHEADLQDYDRIFDTFHAQMAQLRARLTWRWDLAIRIWKIRSALENVDDTTFYLPPVEWSHVKT